MLGVISCCMIRSCLFYHSEEGRVCVSDVLFLTASGLYVLELNYKLLANDRIVTQHSHGHIFTTDESEALDNIA